jgi:hypothetical protein
VLTWHVHGSYLYYLAHAGAEFLLPTEPSRPEGYGGRSGHFPWPDNVREVPAESVREADFDVVLYQSRRNFEIDGPEILSPEQRRLPAVYLEHDPPRESPTDTRHPAADRPDLLLVHVTNFNALMWDAGTTPTHVVEHGVTVPGDLDGEDDGNPPATLELDRGIVVVNGLPKRGRRLGADVFDRVRREVPLDLAGMLSEPLGGLGDVPRHRLMGLLPRYRFFFNPIRYTSLGLAICEAMALGLPVVGLATTELVTVIENGVNGFIDTDPRRLVARMRELLADRELALRLGRAARQTARTRFGIARFAADWEAVFACVAGHSRPFSVGRDSDLSLSDSGGRVGDPAADVRLAEVAS